MQVKSLPKSGLYMHWTSVRFFEMGVIKVIIKQKGPPEERGSELKYIDKQFEGFMEELRP